MNRTLLLALLALPTFTACSGKGDDTAGTNGVGSSCSLSVVSSDPADGATDVSATSVSFTLSGDATGAQISMTDADGATVNGENAVSGDTVTFTPTPPFAGGTQYSASVWYCSDTDEPQNEGISFTTVAGTPPPNLTGKSYTVNIAGATWQQPAGVGSLIGGMITADLLVGVVNDSGGSLELIGATTTDIGAGQNYCSPSIPFPVADFSASPTFSAGPADVIFAVSGYTVPINGLQISGTFASDGSNFTGGQVAGQVDVRDLADIVGSLLGTTDPPTICGLLSGFGATCVTCSSDGEELCIDVLITDITATERPSESVECVDETDCHPMCTDSTCADPTVGECN